MDPGFDLSSLHSTYHMVKYVLIILQVCMTEEFMCLSFISTKFFITPHDLIA